MTRDRPSTKYSFCGAIAIHQELDTLGYQEKPGLSTINQVLKEMTLLLKKSRHKNETTSGKYYPTIKTKHPGHVHQLDLVTPRYTRIRIYCFVNRIDVYTNRKLGTIYRQGC
ncbi:MAG: hypothetical protein MRK02_09575 [Candidatus Scalindua sp.]|nr:hypothetical protein [Candidatus Scalindua sp.]